MLEDCQMDYSQVYTWLSWGGLILPEVVRNKDGSLMGFIRYGQANANKPSGKVDLPEGWAIWLDVHHWQDDEEITLTLLWNPKREKHGGIVNPWSEVKNGAEELPEYFRNCLFRFLAMVQEARPDSRVLKMTEVLSYLKSTLQMQQTAITMPKVPLYLDAVLTMDFELELYGRQSEEKNSLSIKGRNVAVVCLNASLSQEKMQLLSQGFRDLKYRFCRRLLLMSEERLQEELDRFTSNWCRQRENLRKFLLEKQLGVGGMRRDMLIFALEPEEVSARKAYIQEILDTLEIPYVWEEYGRKQCWWGSLPGMFRADGNVLPRKIDDWDEFLWLRGEKENVQA